MSDLLANAEGHAAPPPITTFWPWLTPFPIIPHFQIPFDATVHVQCTRGHFQLSPVSLLQADGMQTKLEMGYYILVSTDGNYLKYEYFK